MSNINVDIISKTIAVSVSDDRELALATAAAVSAKADAEDARDDAESSAITASAAATLVTEKTFSWFPSVAAMRAEESLVPGVTVGTTGYYNPNDGGAAVYTIRTKAQSDVEDGGSIIFLDNGNVAELITDGTVTPEQFGAYGDGVTDDSTAFSSAVNCVKTKILNLTKTYLVYNVTLTKDTYIFGGEINATLTQYNQTKNVLNANSAIDVTLDGVNINGNATGRNNGTAQLENMIRLQNCRNVTIKNCEIHNHAQSDTNADEVMWYLRRIYCINIIDANKVAIENNYIHDNFTEQIAIGSVDAKTSLTILNNRADNNGSAYALFLAYNMKNGVICANTVVDNHRAFLNVCSGNLVVENNYVKNSTSRGISSEYGGRGIRMHNLVIRNNYIENCSEGGIDCGIKDCFVIHNTIIDCGKNVINCTGKQSGDASSVVDSDILPWEVNTLQNAENLVISNNIVKFTKNPANTTDIFYVAGELNIANSVRTYGSLRNVKILGNVINTGDYANVASFVKVRTANEFENVEIQNNAIDGSVSNYNTILGVTSGSSDLIKIKNFSIVDNKFGSVKNTINYYVYCALTTDIENVRVQGNKISKPSKLANFFTGGVAKCLKGYFVCKDNDFMGLNPISRSVALYDNGVVPAMGNTYSVASLSTLPQGLHLGIGDKLTLMIPTANTDNNGYVSVSGTTGTLSGCTATTTAGSNSVVVNNSSLLTIGDDIVIDGSGVTKTKVYDIVDATHILTVDNMTNAVTTANVSYYAPTVLKGGSLSA